MILFINIENLFAQACGTCVGLQFTNPTVSGTFGGAPAISSTTICIDGTFSIDQDFTISGCNIYLDANSVIEVQPNKKLIINNSSYITSCNGGNGDMWRGIHLMDGSSLHVVNSTVEDAIQAVYATPADAPLELVLDGSCFNRNLNHVYIDNSNASGIAYGLNGYIKDCNFLCNVNCGSAVAGQLHAPLTGNITDTAIVMNFITGTVGPDYLFEIGSNNYFQNANAGLHLHHADVHLHDNEFKNVTFGVESFFDCQFKAVANTFNDSQEAIYVHQFVTNPTITDNYIFGNGATNRGITVSDHCINISILRNHIFNSQYIGIRVFDNQHANYTIEVNDNELVNNSINTASYGIIVYENPTYKPNPFNRLQVNNNVITGFNTGIRAAYLYQPEISENSIDIIDNYYPTGILVFVNTRAVVTTNEIRGVPLPVGDCTINADPGAASIGIKIENSYDAYVSCNTVEELHKGFEYNGFLGNITSTAFYENYMGYCVYQFYLRNVLYGLGNIGGSAAALNTWASLGLCGGAGANAYKNTRADNSNHLPGLTNFIELASQSYNDYINNGAPCGFSTTSSVPPNGYCEGSGEQDLMAMIDSMNNDTVYEINYNYWEHEYLLMRSKQDSILNDSLPQLAAIADSLELTNLGLFDELADSLENYQLGTATTLTGLQNMNNGIQPELLIESNYKSVNAVYMQCLQQGINSLSNVQLNLLQQVAGQCPLSGGKAVFLAQHLLEVFTDTIINYDNACAGYVPARKYKIIPGKTNAIVFVNADKDNIDIQFENANISNTGFYLFTQLGACIRTKQFNKGTTSETINISGLTNGIYFYKILAADKSILSSGKITIIK